MSREIPVVTEAPTQSRYPTKAVLRTVVAILISMLVTQLAQTAPPVAEALSQYTAAVVDIITSGVTALLAGAGTWLMANPRVNAFLTAFGLGARPKAVEESADPSKSL